MELGMYLFVVENELHPPFANTEIVLLVYLCLLFSN